jgi:TPR repeat protein
LAIAFASAALADKRVALIVANGAYKGAPLENPTIDADLVEASLANIGFKVKVVKNADLSGFGGALTVFADEAKGADIALFYFAGHGFTVSEGLRPVSMLMSTSADVASSSEFVLRAGGVALDEIVGLLAGEAKATLIFVDACRNDPRVSRGLGGKQRGFDRLDKVQGGSLFIGLSTRLGDTAQDGEAGKGSPFARAFAANIQLKGVRIDDAFRQLRDAVRSETAGKQLPDVVQDDLPNGAIVLASADQEKPVAEAPDKAGSQSPAIGAKTDSRLAEAAQVWATLQDSTNPDALSLFKSQYDGTFYAKLADLRLKQIAANSAPSPAVASLGTQPQPSEQSGLVSASECDQLAAIPDDPTRPSGIVGVDDARIDPARAVPACRAALAASPNDSRVAYQLARALAKAGGAEAEVIELRRKAAEAGSPPAMAALGYVYRTGSGAPKDEAAAARWYRKAADRGYPQGMTSLGYAYRIGAGVPKDDAEALRWFKKAADAGNAPAMLNLGAMYERGAGVQKDEAEAIRWYQKAADLGDASARTNLSRLAPNARSP